MILEYHAWQEKILFLAQTNNMKIQFEKENDMNHL